TTTRSCTSGCCRANRNWSPASTGGGSTPTSGPPGNRTGGPGSSWSTWPTCCGSGTAERQVVPASPDSLRRGRGRGFRWRLGSQIPVVGVAWRVHHRQQVADAGPGADVDREALIDLVLIDGGPVQHTGDGDVLRPVGIGARADTGDQQG